MTRVRLIRELGWSEHELEQADPETVRLLILDINAEQEAIKKMRRDADQKTKSMGVF